MAQDLKAGDQFWADKPFAWGSEERGYGEDDDTGEFCIWEVIRDAFPSINTGLFDHPGTCVVVAVQYADGARGSRLFLPEQKISIRRSLVTS